MKFKEMLNLRSNELTARINLECVLLNLEDIVPEERDRKYMEKYLSEVLKLVKKNEEIVALAIEEELK